MCALDMLLSSFSVGKIGGLYEKGLLRAGVFSNIGAQTCYSQSCYRLVWPLHY